MSEWKLVMKIPIPNFVTTEEEDTIVDCLYVWKKFHTPKDDHI